MGVRIPLHLPAGPSLDAVMKARRANLGSRFVQRIEAAGGFRCAADRVGGAAGAFARQELPRSPEYRRRYAPFLKSGFPRIPPPVGTAFFLALTVIGRRLASQQLMQARGDEAPAFRAIGENLVEKVRRAPPRGGASGRVWSNESRCFAGVAPTFWAFAIGGCRPALWPQNGGSAIATACRCAWRRGSFNDPQSVAEEALEWNASNSRCRLHPVTFVARVVGESVEPDTPEGAYRPLRAPLASARRGRTVPVQLRVSLDPETGQSHGGRGCQSRKAARGDAWRRAELGLKPGNPHFDPIVLADAEEGALQAPAQLLDAPGGERGAALTGQGVG